MLILGGAILGYSCSSESTGWDGEMLVSGDPPEWALQPIDIVEFDPAAWHEEEPEVGIWKLVCPRRQWVISGWSPITSAEPFDLEEVFRRFAEGSDWAVSPSHPKRWLIIMDLEEYGSPHLFDVNLGVSIPLKEVPPENRAEAVALLAHHGRELIEPYL